LASALAASALLTLLVSSEASAAPRSAGGTRSFMLYSVATTEQFLNNKDDRERGKGTNPFGNFHDASATTKQAKGPFPGDEAYFKFAVYESPSLGKPIGDARFACHYNFNRDVYCDAVYELSRGTLVGGGAFSFDASSFTLVITGGSGTYQGLRGDVKTEPATKRAAQRLSFTLG
jgi:hypothetical protein